MHGSDGGMRDLQINFSTGTAVSQSKTRAEYWRVRVNGTSQYAVHADGNHVHQDWMNDVAEPCSSKNPSHTGADDAYRMGRVAYAAHALPTAHCWFRIAALQGNLRASVYLGILDAYGLGVKQNMQNGFAYMYKAASGGDVYGAIYLANFYRYGIGTDPDDEAARETMSYAIDRPNGAFIFSKVEGSLVNDEAIHVMFGHDYEPSSACLESERMRGNLAHPERCYDAEEADRVRKKNEEASDTLAKALVEKTALDKAEEIFPEDLW